jgi:prolyl oligopeptidase
MASGPTWGVADHQLPPPPAARRGDDVDVYRGVRGDVDVADPYRWLENGDDPDVVAWVAEHNQRTRQALEATPSWGRWHERLSALYGLPAIMSVQARGQQIITMERPAGADQYVLMLRSAIDPEVPPRTLVDVAEGSGDHAVAIDWFDSSPDGSLVAYGVSEGGTETSVLHIVDVATGEALTDTIANTRAASIAWLADSGGFWYTRYPEGDAYNRFVYFHRLGDPADDDRLVFDRLPSPTAWPEVDVSDDGRHLLVMLMVGWGQIDVHLCDTTTAEWTVVVEGVEAQTSFLFHGDRLFGVTTRDAPNGRVVCAEVADPQQWRTVVAESDAVLGALQVCGEELLVVETRNAVDAVHRYTLDGAPVGELPLGLVGVQQLTADESLAFVTVAAFDRPPTTYRFDQTSAELRRWCPAEADAGLPKLTVRHVTYPSIDGTEIGMFLIHHADHSPDAATPCILNGYGGFAIANTPAFSALAAAWCEAGGAFAVAGLRGGYEHGETWHHAGRRGNKQNVFDDFHAAGDWLVANGLTSHDRLGIYGGSNGGLLVGAALTQRPDLAAAVWCAVPLLDMVRFPQFLIAKLWTDEYGDPDVPEEFEWVYAYSPYHRVRAGERYPAVLLTTAEGDSRVDPLHARKMAALLAWAGGERPARPVLLHQAGRAGHGVGKPSAMRATEGADALAFMEWQLNAPA